jgi:hypothetical protein
VVGSWARGPDAVGVLGLWPGPTGPGLSGILPLAGATDLAMRWSADGMHEHI